MSEADAPADNQSESDIMPQFVKKLPRRALFLGLAAILLLAGASSAIAAPRRPTDEPPKEPVYALEYAVVIFVPLVALAAVYRPGRRNELEDELKLPFGPKR